MFGFLMCLIIGGYITMMYQSLEFEIYETTTIAAMASVSLLSYIYAIYIKPEYAQLSTSNSDEDFLHLLKKLEGEPNKKICAYCRIEKPEKARHCFICKRCVLEHDKHSFFLNNCVGKENRPFVLANQVCTSVLLLTIVLSALFHYTHVIGDKMPDDKHDIQYFKVLTGITGIMSLIFLIPTIRAIIFYSKSALKHRARNKKLNSLGSSQHALSEASILMERLVEQNLRESQLQRKNST
jgi:hypothetical protein